MDKPKISESRLREIVNEELHRARRLQELASSEPDYESNAKVVGAASKLLKALAAFSDATNELPAVANSAGAHMEALKGALAHMVETPGAYTKKPSEPKVVKLRSQTAAAL